MFLQSPESLLPRSAQNTVQAELWRGNRPLHLNAREAVFSEAESRAQLPSWARSQLQPACFNLGLTREWSGENSRAGLPWGSHTKALKRMQMTQAFWCLGDCGFNSPRARGSEVPLQTIFLVPALLAPG